MVADPVRLSTAEALHARITGAIRRKRQADYDLALMLRDFWEAQLFRELGYISIAEYGEQAHGLGRQKTRALLRLAGAMRDLPELSEAVESGACRGPKRAKWLGWRRPALSGNGSSTRRP